jgi:group II intron reverse transcriptase/maturase
VVSIERTEGQREMRNADTVYSIIRERGKKGLPLERVYRLLYNPELYLQAYAKLYPNDGAMTRGVTSETVDGTSLAKIEQLITSLREGTFRWTPVRRVQIPKKNGKTRPLGIPTWKDKLVQEVIRSILETYFDQQFSRHSHGFRPGRGCHTALTEIQQTWTGVKWFIEGDIAQYFDTIDHEILIDMLGEKIHDEHFLQFMRELLKAGYLEDWTYHRTMSGTPQGGVISPLLSNLYLDKLDRYIEEKLIPAHTKGKRRGKNRAYEALNQKLYRMKKAGQKEGVRELAQQRRSLPSYDYHDPTFRRLHFVRYADDFLIGYVGTRQEAEQIKRELGAYLQNTLKLTLTDEKTLITSATQETARFLGYLIENQQCQDKLTKGRRAVNGRIALRVPKEVIDKKCAQYTQDGKPRRRAELLEESDYSIVNNYQQIYRGVVQYYLLAHNVGDLSKLRWIMLKSLLHTLANKHKTSTETMRKKYQTRVQTPEGKSLQCLEVQVQREGKEPLVARFGGISLARQPQAILNDQPPVPKGGRTEIIKRLLAQKCELCESSLDIEVHHIRKLADLKDKGGRVTPGWKQRMAAMRRKTLVLCHRCHSRLHAGKL